MNEAHILEMKWHFPNESDKDDDSKYSTRTEPTTSKFSTECDQVKAFLAKAVDSRELTPQTIFPFLADVSYLNVWRNVIACCNTYMNRTDEPGRDPWSEVKARALIFVDLRREIVTAFEEAKPRLQGFEDALYGTQMKIVVLDSYVAMYQRTNKREEKISIERWKAGMTSKPFTDEQDGATASPVMDLKKVGHFLQFTPLSRSSRANLTQRLQLRCPQ